MTTQPWSVTVFTLFPEMFPGPLAASVTGRAFSRNLASLSLVNIRDHAKDKHRSVDDTPFGGGAGMVMRPDVLDDALASQASDGVSQNYPLLMLSPRGKIFDQKMAQDLSMGQGVRLICGRYEGIDQRVLDKWQAVEVSLGDFVLTGGELAALVMLDACLRLLPGVVGSPESLSEESFGSGLLEYPHFTRPANWQGRMVPEVLQSGNHAAIRAWRHQQSEDLTQKRRPDLWQRYVMSTSLGNGFAPAHN